MILINNPFRMVKTAVGILAHGYLNRYLLSLKSFTRTAFPSL